MYEESVDAVRISRTMCALLRHGVNGFRIDPEGWAEIGKVADTLSSLLKTRITEEHVIEVAEKDNMGRYELNKERRKIRALYGHSIPVRINYRLVYPNEVDELYHGTVKERIGKILKEGLKPLRRNWVHLYDSLELARERSRRRRGTPIILTINAKTLAAEEKLYKAGKHVYVTKHVPSYYIRKIFHSH